MSPCLGASLATFHVVAKARFCQTNPFRKIPKSMHINKKHKNSASFWRKNEPIFSWWLSICPSVAKARLASQAQSSAGQAESSGVKPGQAVFRKKKIVYFYAPPPHPTLTQKYDMLQPCWNLKPARASSIMLPSPRLSAGSHRTMKMKSLNRLAFLLALFFLAAALPLRAQNAITPQNVL